MISRIIQNAKQIFQNRKMVKQKIILISAFFIVMLICIIGIRCMRKEISINIDGQNKTVITYKNTVKDVFESNGIKVSKEDSVQPALDTKLTHNEIIKVRRAIPVTINSYGKQYKITVLEGSIKNMFNEQKKKLKDIGIEYNAESDEVYPEIDNELKKNMTVKLVKVQKKDVTEKQVLKYDTVTEENDELDESYQTVKCSGVNGEKEVTYQEVYKDGKLYTKHEKSSKVLAEPKNEVVVKGTAKLSASRGGANAGRVMSCSATAYSGGWGTSSGRTPRRVVGGLSTIAVDPSFIPMGSKVYVDGYGYAVAADTGTAIKGNKIDLYFNSYADSCKWGLKQVNVTVIAGPGQW